MLALVLTFSVFGCSDDEAGLCDICQTLSDACFNNTPNIGSLQPGTRETIRCLDTNGEDIPCVCCDDPDQASCDPPQCGDGLVCLPATDGTQRCFEFTRPGLIDGICP